MGEGEAEGGRGKEQLRGRVGGREGERERENGLSLPSSLNTPLFFLPPPLLPSLLPSLPYLMAIWSSSLPSVLFLLACEKRGIYIA